MIYFKNVWGDGMEARIYRARPGKEITRAHERSWPISGMYFPRPTANELRSPITRVRPTNITRYCRLGPHNDNRLPLPPPLFSSVSFSFSSYSLTPYPVYTRCWRHIPVFHPDSKRLFHGDRWRVGVNDRTFSFFFSFDEYGVSINGRIMWCGLPNKQTGQCVFFSILFV